ncbi:tyrosine-protein phosphatase non-receptor type substrate 1-like [Oreochromis aureus]|uniref:tyrosine-protein phosphatase non-receptor type substrate 1-like n=1 Tax=Oreochromis aureus TaxID=47969 RepID=UPI001952E423|nr:tyrosine-protein phosphatase non-receptor type substrate 1-like [Oreochromis aureus]
MKMFFVNVFLLCSSCAAQLSEVSQPESLKTVKIGHSATIKCFIKSASTKTVWYKVTTGRKLQLVVKTDSYYNVREFSDEFVNRSSVKFDMTNNHLTINKTSWEDVGTYFCGVLHISEVQFGSGTFLMLTGAKTVSDSVVQQPESKSVRSGDSVTLSCSLHSAQCTAELTSFMWLKNSNHSAPEMIYCSDNKNNISQRTDRGRTTCEYNFVVRSRDDAGVYYCAVNACGQILLGNGTRIIHADTESMPLGPTVIALMLSNIVLGSVTLLLVVTFCKTRMKKSAEAADEGGQTGDTVIYTSVGLAHSSNKPRQPTVKANGDAVIYSTLKP